MGKMVVRFKEGTAQPPKRQEDLFRVAEQVETVQAEPIYIDRIVEVPVEVVKETIKEVPVEVVKYVEVRVEVPKEVEVIKEVPVIQEIEKIVEVEKKVTVDRPIYIDRIVFKEKIPQHMYVVVGVQAAMLAVLILAKFI